MNRELVEPYLNNSTYSMYFITDQQVQLSSPDFDALPSYQSQNRRVPLVLKKPCGKQKTVIQWVHINETSKTTAHTYMQNIDIQLLKITGPEFLHFFDIFLIFFFCQLSVNAEHLYLECDIRACTKGSSKSRHGNTNSILRFSCCQIFMASTQVLIRTKRAF